MQFGRIHFHWSTLTVCFELWPPATSSFLRILRTVGSSLTLLCDDAAQLHSSCRCLQSPNPSIGSCTESKGPVSPLLVLDCISPAAICIDFANSYTQYLHIFCLHSRCPGHVLPTQFHFHPVHPRSTGQCCTVPIGISTTHKVATIVFFLC